MLVGGKRVEQGINSLCVFKSPYAAYGLTACVKSNTSYLICLCRSLYTHNAMGNGSNTRSEISSLCISNSNCHLFLQLLSVDSAVDSVMVKTGPQFLKKNGI